MPIDRMVDQIAAYHDGDVPEKTRELYRDCLMGRIPITAVLPSLPSSDDYYYADFYEDTDEIAKECRQDEKLLPCLGTHLKILKHIGQSIYRHATNQLSSGLDPISLFIRGGLGATELLAWKFGGGAVTDGAPEILEAMFEMYPDELGEFAMAYSGERKIELLAFLCAKKNIEPFDFVHGQEKKFLRIFSNRLEMGREFVELCMRCLYAMVSGTGGGWDRLVALVKPVNPSLASYMVAFEDSASWDWRTNFNQGADALEFARALSLTGGKFKDLNQLALAACKMSYNMFIGYFYEALCSWKAPLDHLTHRTGNYDPPADNSAEEQMVLLEESMAAFAIPKAYLCAWAARLRLGSVKFWKPAWEKLYSFDIELLKNAAKLADAPEKLALYRELEDLASGFPLTECVSAVSKAFYAQFSGFLTDREAQRLHRYIMMGDGTEESLPSINAFVRKIHPYSLASRPFDISCLLLTGFHHAGNRYFHYLAHGRHSGRVAYAVIFLRDVLGMSADAVAQFIMKPPEGKNVVNVMLCLAKETVESQIFSARSENSEFVRQIVERLISHYPEQAMALVSNATDELTARLQILNYLCGAECDAEFPCDDGFFIGLLGDKSKKIHQQAVSTLIKRKASAEKIRPLLNSDKKAVRDAAKEILAAYKKPKEPTATF